MIGSEVSPPAFVLPLATALTERQHKGNITKLISQIYRQYLTLLNAMKRVIDLKSLRDAVGKTQIEIAELLGVGQSYISEIESGNKNVSKRGEAILIAQFGEDICDKFRIDKIDARRTQNFKGPVSGGKMPMGDLYEGEQRPPQTTGLDLQSQLDECRAELAKAKKDLEQANKRIDKLLSIIENLSKE